MDGPAVNQIGDEDHFESHETENVGVFMREVRDNFATTAELAREEESDYSQEHLDLSGRNIASPYYIYNEYFLDASKDTMAKILTRIMEANGVTDKAKLTLFHNRAQEYLGRRTVKRKHLATYVMKALEGDNAYVSWAIQSVFAVLRDAFIREFQAPLAQGRAVLPPVNGTATINSSPPASPNSPAGSSGLQLDAETIRQLGYTQAQISALESGAKHPREIDRA